MERRLSAPNNEICSNGNHHSLHPIFTITFFAGYGDFLLLSSVCAQWVIPKIITNTIPGLNFQNIAAIRPMGH